MQGTVAERIRNARGRLTPLERRIADALFDSDLVLGLENVAGVAQQAKVSGPTVVRFVIKLGFPGFPQFQSALRNELRERLASPLDHYQQILSRNEKAPPAAGMSRVFTSGISRTLGRLKAGTLTAACRELLNPSRRVSLVGGRFTHLLAQMLWAHLHQLRADTVMLRANVVSLPQHVFDMGPRDVLVVFDVRRYQADIVELARLARRQRATLILVTDPMLSPIARWAKYVFVCDLDTPSPHHSLVPCLALVEALVGELGSLCGEPGRSRIARLEMLRDDARSV